MPRIAVVHLVRIGNGIETLQRFLESYRENAAGLDHDLIVVLKGFSTASDELREVRAALAGVDHREIEVEDAGYDITAYFAAARALEHDYFCFLNSFSVLLHPDWLEKLCRHAVRPGVGLVGATGSAQSQYSVSLYWQLKRKPFRWGAVLPRLLRRDARLERAIHRKLAPYAGHFDPFPSYHVRTNAFVLSRETLSKIDCDGIETKMDAYWFESGARGLTRQVGGMGLETLVVGRDGIGYRPEEWHESDTFCSGKMDNLLVADNQTRDYAEGDDERQDFLFRHTWVDPLAWHTLRPATPAERCPSCEGTRVRRPLRVGDLNRGIGDDVFDYYRCARCGYVYLDPIPDDLGPYYAGGYYQFPESLDEWLPAVRQHEGYKVDVVDRFAKGRRLLEIGPSIGGALYLAKDAGYDVEGIEMDAQCCAYMRDRLGIEATQSPDARAVLEGGGEPYDVIMAWHVIEHLPDHAEVLAAAADRLAPGGILVVAAPAPDSLQWKLFRRLWAHLDAPRHVALVPANVVKIQMMSRGLHLEWSTSRDPGGRGWNRFGWEHSWRLLLSRLMDREGRSMRLERALARICEAIAWPIEVLLDRGTAYTLVFRRTD